MDISIDTFADKDLKKFDEFDIYDVDKISIDFRGQCAIFLQLIYDAYLKYDSAKVDAHGEPVSFGPKRSKRDISLPVLSLYVYVRIWRGYWCG